MTAAELETLQHAVRGGTATTVAHAKQMGASDIHITPNPNDYAIRFRVHGVLSEPLALGHETGRTLVQAFKAACKMNIAEQRKPQDGRLGLSGIELRLAIHPSLHGENLVIRLLGTHSALNLHQLGLADDARDLLVKMTQHEHGLTLIAGATGSGKTTTLHAILNHLGSRAGRITTLEDPVEIINPNAVQTDLSRLAHVTFSSGLRSLMRQDPDTILVGEIRDEETAELTLQAALTGHRVLASIHAPDCIGALCRLCELNVRWSSLLNCLNGVVAQRLVLANTHAPSRKLVAEVMHLRAISRAALMSCASIESLMNLQHSQSFLPFEIAHANPV